ncbi:MAG: cell envelope biogenesis protein TolA, partial [Rhodobacteraceae bacterium]|nr:cell envelope biogenesis protein TolA [Paracoccaceae bacterium]
MDRSERIGVMVSGAAHLGALLWLMLGGIFFSHDVAAPVVTAEVTLMSEADFSALQAAAPRAAETAPAKPAPAPAPAPEP